MGYAKVCDFLKQVDNTVGTFNDNFRFNQCDTEPKAQSANNTTRPDPRALTDDERAAFNFTAVLWALFWTVEQTSIIMNLAKNNFAFVCDPIKITGWKDDFMKNFDDNDNFKRNMSIL